MEVQMGKTDERIRTLHRGLCVPSSKVQFSASSYHIGVANGNAAWTKYPPIY